jgi:hypothetical protein
MALWRLAVHGVVGSKTQRPVGVPAVSPCEEIALARVELKAEKTVTLAQFPTHLETDFETRDPSCAKRGIFCGQF